MDSKKRRSRHESSPGPSKSRKDVGEKHSKHNKKKSKSKHRKRSRSSSSESSSSDSSIKFLQKLQAEREKKVKLNKLGKEMIKATEAPEEKRLRRLKKKEEKERKRKERMGWDNDYLHYTNTDNPFGDANLLSTFVWKKKLDKDGLTNITSEELEKRNRGKQDENRRELEKVKKRRIERELERQQREEEMALLQRNKEAAAFQEYGRHEDEFHLEQARLRSKIRIQDGRAKPIDLLAKYISAEEEVDAVEMHEPYTYLHGLACKDLEDLVEDIKVYKELEKGKNLDYWHDITVIVEDELHKLRKLERQSEYEVAVGRREGIHQSVASDVAGVFKGKTAVQLEALQQQIESKISGQKDGIDIGYWESLLSQLKAHMARARLRDRHQDNLRHKLQLLKAQQGVEVPVKEEPESSPSEKEDGESQSEKEEEAVAGPSAATDLLSESFAEYQNGQYSPRYLQPVDLEPGTLVCPELEDEQRLSYARATMLGTGRRVESVVSAEERQLHREARKGMTDDEVQFSVESSLDAQVYLWSDKYRPRKPRYFNRVHTGFEWNKYNQTHYDMDNPPPKIVQGYKFNIFYPDLIDKSATPEYFMTPCPDNPDFAVLRFHAGPPYEDIAFKIVNREWEYSYKRGFRCQFHNNIFQLWFHFKRDFKNPQFLKTMEEGEKDEPVGSEDMDAGGQLRHRKLMSSARETLDSASRLLRKKIPCTGHLMTPRKLWIQMVPTRECDVVVMFPPGASDSTLMWLLQRLKESSPGLQVQVRHHSSSDSYGFYLTAPFKVLLQAAEEYHLPKSVLANLGGGLKEFLVADAACFSLHDDEAGFFTTQERQWLVLKLLHNLRAGAADVAGGMAGVRLNEGQAIVPKLSAAGVISQVFPLHDMPVLGRLQRIWVRAVLEAQPLDEVCEYFGVKIAMYFAWLGHYTTALIVPAVVGFLFWVGFGRGDQATEDIGFVLFSLFNVLWASIYLEAWKRYSATLAYRWGTLDQRDDLLAEPRPLFKGPLEQSQVTNRMEPSYPEWKRNVFRYCVTVPVISLCLAVVFVVMVIILQLQDWWDHILETRGYPFFLSYFPKILLAVVITCMDDAYYKVACWLNEKENYRADTKFENHLIVKVALFQFVNSFLSLFYIAFFLQDLERLKEQLAALLITRQVIGNIKESALPYLLEQLRLAKLSFDLFGALSPTEAKGTPGASPSRKPASNRNVGQAELESTLFKYNGTFDDHLEMLIQLGYVVLFSSAFPMAACCALINNLIEIRSDAFKLCFIFQRPFGQRVASIGSWQSAMELMGITAVMVNCALIGISGHVHRMFPNMSTTQTILLIVALEHVVLILRYIISHSIPDLPDWVATEMAKVEFARREAVRRSSAPSTFEAQPAENFGRFVVSPAASQDEREGSESLGLADLVRPSSKRASVSSNREAGSSPGTPVTPDGKIQKIPPFNRATTPGTPDGKTQKLPYASKPATPDGKQPRRETTQAGTPEARPRPRLNDWLATEEPTQHLTIGSHAGADWVRRLALDKTRKTSEPSEVGSASDALSSCRSTDCIPKDASSSDSDLLRSAPPWSRPRFRFSPEPEPKPVVKQEPKPAPKPEPKAEPPPKLPSPGEASSSAATPEELAAKKARVKQSLIKRARSVAMFSLKLKEKRAREGKPEPKPEPPRPVRPPETVGGELACIPLEMLISVDDVAKDLQRRHHQPN